MQWSNAPRTSATALALLNGWKVSEQRFWNSWALCTFSMSTCKILQVSQLLTPFNCKRIQTRYRCIITYVMQYITISHWYILYQEAQKSGKPVLSAFQAEGRSVPPAWHRSAHWMILDDSDHDNVMMEPLQDSEGPWLVMNAHWDLTQCSPVGNHWDMSDRLMLVDTQRLFVF